VALNQTPNRQAKRPDRRKRNQPTRYPGAIGQVAGKQGQRQQPGKQDVAFLSKSFEIVPKVSKTAKIYVQRPTGR